ncbi:hypothetical protein PBI_SEBATA_223 [Mycobacterium phage Sebata]|uniref:Uncharacterized protein n=1 Tax=Mycobacterium phage Sebata TaxID=1052672 RepID=G1FIT4_9CAUD|nr:hypothetical protein FDI20_gp125 [Mycobacterium phage Sebata]AEK06666.1 hypothetical protein PBI_SEBATA_223 [Mycobacterium phage Sebata]QAY10013.1 hypothetical protein PBI_FLABSLAB_217 [Mycobacterium phage Flabslab]QOC58301.1 hypothetical protein SEA_BACKYARDAGAIN_218 [Mycobacterium phage BackyardAgain]
MKMTIRNHRARSAITYETSQPGHGGPYRDPAPDGGTLLVWHLPDGMQFELNLVDANEVKIMKEVLDDD